MLGIIRILLGTLYIFSQFSPMGQHAPPCQQLTVLTDFVWMFLELGGQEELHFSSVSKVIFVVLRLVGDCDSDPWGPLVHFFKEIICGCKEITLNPQVNVRVAVAATLQTHL